MSVRTLLWRIAAERRRVLVPLALLAAVNLVLYVGLVYPLTLRVNSSESRAAAARERLRAAEQEAKGLSATESSTERAMRDLERFYQEVLPQDISGARRLTYARLDELARNHGLLAERRTYAIDGTYQGRLRKLRIEMALAGEYEDVRSFIHALETGSEFVVIEDVSLAAGPDADDLLTLRLRLATYYPEPADGP